MLKQSIVCVFLMIFIFEGCGVGSNAPQAEVLEQALSGPAVVKVAPDASAWGAYTPRQADYKFSPRVHAMVLDDRPTELWARVYYPQQQFDPEQEQTEKLPLIVMLHGNHSTCGTGFNPRYDDDNTYTTTGLCPHGYTVVPNHVGYAYVAERLASHGYLVVSINVNRGINAGNGPMGDYSLNLARGKMILRHLSLLAGYNSWAPPCVTLDTSPEAVSAGIPTYVPREIIDEIPLSMPHCIPLPINLENRIDFNQVGLTGHSRGGEGVRAAYHFYNEAGSPWPAAIGTPIEFRGIFEIAATDGQTAYELNADNIP